MVATICMSQQESKFSYYMFNHQAINPAYTGSRGITNLTSVIRSQWVGIEGAPETQTITFGKSLNSKNLGYGISVLNDKIGPTKVFPHLPSFSKCFFVMTTTHENNIFP